MPSHDCLIIATTLSVCLSAFLGVDVVIRVIRASVVAPAGDQLRRDLAMIAVAAVSIFTSVLLAGG